MGIHNLTDRTIKAAKTACTLRDGGGLELRVKNENSKSWVLRKTVNGLRKEYGLGSLVDVPLKVARDKAEQYRQLIDQGIDPKIYLNGLATGTANDNQLTTWHPRDRSAVHSSIEQGFDIK